MFRYWTDEGICWARNSKVYDVDDTAMGFRLLRLHGHKVSAGKFAYLFIIIYSFFRI
jgi:ent-copalyl diphosphate synthase